jgi:hypothetical protein
MARRRRGLGSRPRRASKTWRFFLKASPASPFQWAKVTTMAQGEKDKQSASRERRFITEQELMDALNRSLWEVERRRAQESVGGPGR